MDICGNEKCNSVNLLEHNGEINFKCTLLHVKFLSWMSLAAYFHNTSHLMSLKFLKHPFMQKIMLIVIIE